MSSSQSETGALQESIENVRYNIFKKVEEMELDSNNLLFKKSSVELSQAYRLTYPNYFEKLIDAEIILAIKTSF